MRAGRLRHCHGNDLALKPSAGSGGRLAEKINTTGRRVLLNISGGRFSRK